MLGLRTYSAVQLLLAATALFFATLVHPHHIEFNITVPPFKIDQEDAYVCVSGLLPPNPHKLIGVIPHARQEVVHHILLYGCKEPHLTPRNATDTVAWRCDMQPVCNGPSTVLYGWGRNAPDLHLPEGVGFSVGERTGIKYIVAQVHYLALRPPEDHSGVTLVLKPHAVPYAAGLMSYASWFQIPPGAPSHLIQNSCCFKSHQPLTMFAVRVHTHVLGRQVYMTREMWNGTGSEVLVSRDPQLPQSFVPTPRHTLAPGDRLTVTCDFNSTSKTTSTNAGPTHNDEMCNMYVMVYGKTPYLTMCDNSRVDIRDDSPGALPRQSSLLPDPSLFWNPPLPAGGPAPGSSVGASASSSSNGSSISNAPYGDATGVTTGPDGSLWVLYRASGVWLNDTFDPDTNRVSRTKPVPEPVVVQLDPDTGAVLQRWGGGVFYVPHGIAVDVQGNVWVTDVGRHQVLKFSPDGALLLSAGKERIPGSGRDTFCMPTQVSVLRDGSFLVADGYCNSRVVWMDAKGGFIAESAPIAPAVHSVLVDECEGLVYAGSREGAAVVALELDRSAPLQLRATHDMAAAGHGMVWALRFGPYGEQLALTWNEGEDARLVHVRFPSRFWTLPGTARLSPHDFQLGAAPLELSGSGDRLFAVYLAAVGTACDAACGPLHKFVVVPHGWHLPDAATLAAAHAATKEVHPGDAVLLPTSASVTGGNSSSSGGKEEAKAEEAEGEHVVNVADDYDEDVAGDAVAAADYEAEVAEKKEHAKEEREREADYQELFTGVRPNTTAEEEADAPLGAETERYEVLMVDKETVKRFTTTNGWALAVAAVMAVVMAAVVIHYSRTAMKDFSMPWSKSGSRVAVAANGGAAATAATDSVVGGGGSGGGKARVAAEVEAARDRERLLRSEP